jgi:uncharacterized protein with gpF-like domain
VKHIVPILRGHALAFDADGGAINPLTVNAPDLIRWIEARDPRAIESWRDIGPEEYARAFTAARTAGLDIVDDLYFAFADTIERGGTEVDYAKLVIPTLQRKGWLGGDAGQIASRVALIYDTNLRMARGSGQWERIQRTKSALPYLRAATARDDRVRHPPKSPHSDHTAWDGIVLPVDHPFWLRGWVPLGFRCRCTIIPMTRSQLARSGRKITTAEDLAQREARLGTPVFITPGAGIPQQLASVAAIENNRRDRMGGLPIIDVAAERSAASALWNVEAGAEAIATLIGKLFA